MKIITSIDETLIKELRAKQEFFWLDLVSPSVKQVEQLGSLLSLHPLAVEDSINFKQRPKLDIYENSALLVLAGTVQNQTSPHSIEEIHCYISGDYIVTLHHKAYEELEQLMQLLKDRSPIKSEEYYVYKVIDAIVDSYFPPLADLDKSINDLENAIVSGVKDHQLEEIFRLKRLLLQLRKVVVPMRDVFARQIEAIASLSGLESDSHDYFRDVYDHLIRITDELDSYHEMVGSCTDLYLSMIANRQGEISKQLTIIASIFLPLTFLTGFFGMNFGWEVNHIQSLWNFVLFGIGIMIVSVIAMAWWFHHKGWVGHSANR
ncbi:MAG TPA: magnesium/cobalt transporter CorA [Candidatus Saccharimonadales bacterium]|nr:magnesium/cobalt transporter CorA [Candidatus Saccharimonadales bacterium]